MKKNILFALLAAMMPAVLWAVPARPTVTTVSQPDGTTISIRKIGDERAHVVLSADGYPVVIDGDGFYCYADFDADGLLKSTAVKVKETSALTAAERERVGKIDMSRLPSLLEARVQASPMSFVAPVSRADCSGIGLMDDAFLGRKELKGLVILAQYQDVKFSDMCDHQFFVDMLNSEGFDQYGATGSAKDYFIASSDGKFIPEFDVYGPVTLPDSMAYYGGNNANGNDRNAARMIFDACKGLDGEIDFSEYDLDGDGYVDNVFVFYAGYGEATDGTADSVWPHQWSLSSGGLRLTLDGVIINKYACSNEIEKKGFEGNIPCGVGTFVHEFSHVLGLPDLYVTSGSSGGWTPGIWDVLDMGPYNNNGRTPPSYSVYERNALGWIEPMVLSGAESVELRAINESNEGCVIMTGSENEFYLIENRQKTEWDAYLPGHGMLVWHIDYNPTVWARNSVNNQQNHNYVDLVEARGGWVSQSDFYFYAQYLNALADYAFPGNMGVTSFTDDTYPSMKTWSGKALGLPITGIQEVDGVIKFDIAGGRCEAEVPVIKEPAAIGDRWFEAAWEPSAGAADYILSVKAFVGEGEPVVEVADFAADEGGYTLPDGWTYIGGAGAFYTDPGYYGNKPNSLKLSKTGAGLQTRLYESDVDRIEFWMKGFSTNAKSSLIVEGLVNGEWTELQSFAPNRTAGVVCKVDDIPEGVKQVKFTYSQSLGNVAIDDVTVTTSADAFVSLPDYSMIPVGNVNSHRVDKLMDGVDVYTYRVCAVDGSGRRSEWSDEQTVTLDSGAGIDDVTACEVSVTVSGREVMYAGTPAAVVTLTDLAGRSVAQVTAGADGRATVSAPGRGVYFLSDTRRVSKLIIK